MATETINPQAEDTTVKIELSPEQLENLQQIQRTNEQTYPGQVYARIENLKDNPMQPRRRGKGGSHDANVKKKRESFLRTGYQYREPIIATGDGRKATKDKQTGKLVLDGELTIMQGHGRVDGARSIFDAAPDVADVIFPDGLIPVNFVPDLDARAQREYVNDHNKDETPTTDVEKMAAGIALKRAGAIQKEISRLVDRGTSQHWGKLVDAFDTLPEKVQNLFMEGRINQKQLNALYQAGRKDGDNKGFAMGDNYKATIAEVTAAMSSPGSKGVSPNLTLADMKKEAERIVGQLPFLDKVLAPLKYAARRNIGPDAKDYIAEANADIARVRTLVDKINPQLLSVDGDARDALPKAHKADIDAVAAVKKEEK